MREHKVTFLISGGLMDERTSSSISAWDPVVATAMTNPGVGPYVQHPYGFFFETFLTAPPVADGEGGFLCVQPRRVATSGVYYLGGKVLCTEDLDRSKDRVLLDNMRMNDWPLVVLCKDGTARVFDMFDCIVDERGGIVDRGGSPKYEEVRGCEMLKSKVATSAPSSAVEVKTGT